MTDTLAENTSRRPDWLRGRTRRLVNGLTGVLAILVAVKATLYTPGMNTDFAYQDLIARFVAFASLTVWASFCLGIRRRGFVAIAALAFATFLELVIVPARGYSPGALVYSNLGIVFAYCGLELYGFARVQKRRQRQS